jgi:glycosyltransferase involved in cell wall biosynthesis
VKATDWHLVTSEYPPQAGGVSDYTRLVAEGLAAAGDVVHVWCPSAGSAGSAAAESETAAASGSETAAASGLFVHRELGRFTPSDLRRAGKLLDEFGAPRRLLVQWVPHGYGYQSMNLPFCVWLWNRAARSRDAVEVMVHEPYLAFGEGSWKQNGVAAVHRLMAIALLGAARRVWLSIPAWEGSLRPYALGRALPFRWLPVASNIPVVDDDDGAQVVRARYATTRERVVGHFGTYGRSTTELLKKAVPALLRASADCVVLLIGRGSEAMRDELTAHQPELSLRLRATGSLAAAELSLHISACDVMLQPYIDGASSRRTSLMVCLSHGVPVVTTSGRLSEPLWAASEAVALAPAGEAAALVETTARLLADDERRRRMSLAARSLYEERFDVKRTIKALREAFA